MENNIINRNDLTEEQLETAVEAAWQRGEECKDFKQCDGTMGGLLSACAVRWGREATSHSARRRVVEKFVEMVAIPVQRESALIRLATDLASELQIADDQVLFERTMDEL